MQTLNRKANIKTATVIIMMVIVLMISSLSLTALASVSEDDYEYYDVPGLLPPDNSGTDDGSSQDNNQGSEPETDVPDIPDDSESSGGDSNNQDGGTGSSAPNNNNNNGNREPPNPGESVGERGPHITYTAADFNNLQQLIAGMSTTNGYTVYVPNIVMTSEIAIPQGVDVMLIGVDGEAQLLLEVEGERHFTVYGILRLHSNIVLEGAYDYTFNHGGVEVADGGWLLLSGGEHYGSMIVGNTAVNGGGVNVSAGGMLTMYHGSIIADNTATAGGGVNVDVGATFIMYGGNIFSNIATEQGGGVAVYGGELAMHSGYIFANDSTWGGGVAVWDGEFTMIDGTITVNSAIEDSGAVGVKYNSSFVMYNGYITYNFVNGELAHALGGGVYVQDSEFVMHNGEISNNLAGFGGNVAVYDGEFTMHNGMLSEGTALVGGGMFYYGDSSVSVRNGGISSSNITLSADTTFTGFVTINYGVCSFDDSNILSMNLDMGVEGIDGIDGIDIDVDSRILDAHIDENIAQRDNMLENFEMEHMSLTSPDFDIMNDATYNANITIQVNDSQVDGSIFLLWLVAAALLLTLKASSIMRKIETSSN